MAAAEHKSDLELKKDTAYLALTGELWCVCCGDFGENWSRYTTTPHCIALRHIESRLHHDNIIHDKVFRPYGIPLHRHADVIKWKHFPRYWPFVRGIHRSPVNSPHKGQWRGTLMCSMICAWINSWVNNREAGDFRRYRTHYDVTVMAQRTSNTEIPAKWYNLHICHWKI